MKFNDIIGQKTIKDKLIQMIEKSRIPHALLFSGPEGSGILPAAVAFTQFINCMDRSANDSCGKCSSCVKFEKLVHPDLHFIFPLNTTKKYAKNPTCDDLLPEWRMLLTTQKYFEIADWYEYIGLENKQGLIGKNESELVIKKLGLKAFESEYKTMIIWMPELMNQTSANMLLKLIEEPPANTILILVSNHPENILPTITSRTQMFRFSKISTENLKETAKIIFGMNEEKAGELANLADGSFVKLKKLIEFSEEENSHLDLFIRIMRLVYGRNIHGMNQWVDDVASLGREKIKRFFDYCIRMVRENFILHLNQEELSHLTHEERTFSDKFYPFINGKNIIPLSEEISTAYHDIERNGYAKLILLDFSLKLMKLIKN